MKKLFLSLIVAVMTICLLGECCKAIDKYNYHQAKQIKQTLVESDNDGDGHFVSLNENGFLGYKVIYHDWNSDKDVIYRIGW